MGKGLNKVMIIGNIGHEPELRTMPNGSAVATISVATSETWKDKATGAKQERTEWHQIVFFNKLAEIVRDYLHKGSKVYVEGQLRTKKWQDKQTGETKYSTQIIASEMKMLDKRPEEGQQQQQQEGAPPPIPPDFTDEIPF